MEEKWASKAEWIAVSISALAFLLAGITAYEQFWPADKTRAFISHASFSMEEGRFGSGPSLLAAVSFVNLGNQPIILSSLVASYGYAADGPARSCDIAAGRWTGFPWEEVMEAGGVSAALPRPIFPGAASTVYRFEASAARPALYPIHNKMLVCLKFEMISSEGEVFETRHPIAILSFYGEEIQDVVFVENYRSPVTVVP